MVIFMVFSLNLAASIQLNDIFLDVISAVLLYNVLFFTDHYESKLSTMYTLKDIK